MRKAINNLQSLNMAYDKLDYETVIKFTGYPPINTIKNIYENTQKNQLNQCHNNIKNIIEDNQYAVLELITEMHNYLLDMFLCEKIRLDKFTNIITKLKNIEQNVFLCPPNDMAISAFIACFY